MLWACLGKVAKLTGGANEGGGASESGANENGHLYRTQVVLCRTQVGFSLPGAARAAKEYALDPPHTHPGSFSPGVLKKSYSWQS